MRQLSFPSLLIGLLTMVSQSFADCTGRVVSIGGDITEIVYALEQEHCLVATDTTSVYPAKTDELPKVGYLRALSVEGIASLKPDLVIASDNAGPATIWPQLQTAGIPVVRVTAQTSLSAVEQKIQQVAAAFGTSQRGEQLASLFRKELQSTDVVSGKRATPDSPQVLFILGHGGGTPMVAGEDTSAATIIQLAGGRNAFSGFSGYKPMTAEAVVQANPDIIVVTSQGQKQLGGVTGVLNLPGIKLTEAGKNRRVLDYDALLLLGFGLRTPSVLAQIKADFQENVEGE
ncbi:ABC transporter substrate-binding protein [bacterium SCSIO 12696]|nr:ABC transporter substrate-binding protein [bacterium SCSIO 12696]